MTVLRAVVAVVLFLLGVLYLGNGSSATLGLAAIGVVLIALAVVAWPLWPRRQRSG